MSALRLAERQLMDLVVALHWIAGQVADDAVAHHLRGVADKLNDAAMELRSLWELPSQVCGAVLPK